jgi:uncharacterized protein YndB with AHSA1/START domain
MHTLTLTERLAAPLERVFAAWSSAEQVRRWFAPGDMRVPEAEVDLRPGGRYRIVMEEKDGQRHVVTGEYREIVPNERLAFTWQWEGSEAVTFVEVEFRAIDDGGTELSLVHTQFAAEEHRDMHGKGWRGCLANLQAYLRTAGPKS